MMIRQDYAKVGVPMLPVVAGELPTARQILVYTVLLVPTTLLLVYPLGVLGSLYAISAIALGGLFIAKSWALLQNPTDLGLARSLFKYSIFYMMLLCAAMGLDSLPATRELVALISNSVGNYIAAVL